MSNKTQQIILGTMLLGSLVACSPREDNGDQDEEQQSTESTVQNDQYGNIALFEASRSKIKFALAFVENYYPYIYWCGEAWTTGHGLTILYNADGSSKKVTQNTPIPTLEQSDVYKGRYLTHEILPDIKSCIKVPMDENTMITACVLRYCLGHSNFVKSQFVKQLNAGKKGAELAKTLTGWRKQEGVINRCYFFAALMSGKIQYSDLLDLRAEGCYNLVWQDMLVFRNGNPVQDADGFCTWDFSKIQANLQKAKNPRTVSLNLGRKRGRVKVDCKVVREIVPDYIWQEVSNGKSGSVLPQDTTTFAEAEQTYTCGQLNDSSLYAYQNDDFEAALQFAEAAYKIAQTNKEIGASTYNIGMAYLAMGKYERAVRYLKKSYEVNPTADAKKALDEAIPKRNANRCWAGGGMFLGVLGLEAKRRRR